MKKVLIGIFALIGLLAVLSVLAAGAIGIVIALAEEGVPDEVILEADFERGVVEAVPSDALAEYMLQGVTPLQDIVAALDRAAEDDRVKAFVARIGSGGMGLAHTQEVRDAVLRFRESGKPAVAWAETFGEFGPGNGGYYLATAFDEVYLQPSGDVGLTGLIYETPFIRDSLDKLGVEPRIGQRYQYKNAANTYNERGMTEPHREAMTVLMGSQFDQMVRGIAEARSLTPDDVRRIFDGGPYYGAEAQAAGLVDGIAYRDEVYAAVREKAGEDAELLYLGPYLDRAGRPNASGETIALIHGYGAVSRGRDSYSPLDGSVIMGSDTVAGAFRAAIDDDSVRAIVFRVDSPGGSYVASDTIRREVTRAVEAGKPVIVSMGNLAASGGYFVSMDATKIVAQPGTITASIGVFGGKFLTSGFWNKLGINWEDVHTSANGTIWTGTHAYDEAEEARVDAGLDRIYEDFTAKVAEGRGIPLDRVQEIARGRIWTGETAMELGLVDELGGIDVALRLAREAAGIEADEEVDLERFPAPRPVLEQLLGEEPENSEEAALVAALQRTLGEIQPVVRLLSRLGIHRAPEALSMPDPGAF